MFDRARLKLTTWYLVIIMAISVLFSIAFYQSATHELDRFRRIEYRHPDISVQINSSSSFFAPRLVPTVDPQEILDSENRLKILLLGINLFILGVSGLAGFFLAGRTLRPIQEMVEEQNQFITDASHELRTPLTSLKSEIEVNLRDRKLSLPEARQLLESNLEEVNNLQALSDGLISLTQYKRNNIPFEDLSIKEVAKESERKVTPLARRKDIKIENKVADIKIYGSKQLLTELLVILLDNAIKYSPDKTTIKISSQIHDSLLTLAVRDQGIGIGKSEMNHLFDRFYRTDKSRAKNIPGYGLGLSIAKEIVIKHSGEIKVESEEGKGSTFTIKLPLRRSA